MSKTIRADEVDSLYDSKKKGGLSLRDARP